MKRIMTRKSLKLSLECVTGVRTHNVKEVDVKDTQPHTHTHTQSPTHTQIQFFYLILHCYHSSIIRSSRFDPNRSVVTPTRL